MVETVRIEPSGVRALRGGVMIDHHSIHEGMDWGAVGLPKNDPREPAEMTVTKLKCPTKQNTEMNTQNPTSKARKLVSNQNMRRETLDRVGSFRDGYPRLKAVPCDRPYAYLPPQPFYLPLLPESDVGFVDSGVCSDWVESESVLEKPESN